jgi:hypothetical protein
MTYSTSGPSGPLADVGLSGSTTDGKVTEAYVGSDRADALAATPIAFNHGVCHAHVPTS